VEVEEPQAVAVNTTTAVSANLMRLPDNAVPLRNGAPLGS
jgi:hypothetical protein